MTHAQFVKQLPRLVKNYKPSKEVLAKLNQLELLIIIGPTGVGKSTIIDQLGIPYVISDTTRKARLGEQEGIDFFFRQDYQKLIQELQKGEFVQAAVDPSGELKATKADYYPAKGRVVMAVVADAVPTFRELGFKKTISVFIVPPTYDEWMRRLKRRLLAEEELAKRLNEAKRSLKFALEDKSTHLILNDKIDKAVDQIKKTLAGNVNPAREEQARKSVTALLDGIN